MSRVPVTVLTGFLGAGKTTLLRSLLTQADGRRIAVIVNEFGDAGFDGGLVEECAAKACAPGDIVELTNGCICCTVADDFIPTMDKLLARDRPLDAIVIETSGLALPQPLLKAFDWPAVRTRATVDGVVTVVDALALSEGRVTIDEDAVAAQRAADDSLDHDDPIEEVFEDQLACADLVVLSKSDLVSPAALAGIEARLKSVLRPGVNIVRSKGDLAAPVLIGLNAAAEDDMAARAGHHGEEEEHDHDDFDSIVVMPSAAASVDAMRARVSNALNLTGVLRVKGHARIADKAAPIVVQGVGGRVDLAFARPDVKQAEHLVVIGLKGFDGDAVRRALAGVAKDFHTDAPEARQQRQYRRWRRRPRSRAGARRHRRAVGGRQRPRGIRRGLCDAGRQLSERAADQSAGARASGFRRSLCRAYAVPSQDCGAPDARRRKLLAARRRKPAQPMRCAAGRCSHAYPARWTGTPRWRRAARSEATKPMRSGAIAARAASRMQNSRYVSPRI